MKATESRSKKAIVKAFNVNVRVQNEHCVSHVAQWWKIVGKTSLS
jgi:hypothetical protein